MAPASVGIDTFPNKKPKLFGDLNLDVTRSTSVSAISDGDTGIGFGTEIIHSTVVANVTIPNSSIFLFVETEQNGVSSINSTGRIRKDNLSGIILGFDSASGSNAPILVSGIDNNLPVGTHTYVFTAQRNVATTTTWDTFPNTWNGLVIIITPNDTHTTKNTNVING